MTKSYVAFLLDRSGSMGTIWDDTIGGLNAYVDGLKAEPDAEITFSLVSFDQGPTTTHVKSLPIAEVPAITNADVSPRGGTALIDAAYALIEAVKSKAEGSDRVVVAIQTDGDENSSRQHSWEALNALVAERKAAGWEFVFLGAGIDAYKQAARMGVSAESTMSYSRTKSRAVFGAMASTTRDYSAGRSATMEFSAGQRADVGDIYAPDLGQTLAKSRVNLVDRAAPLTQQAAPRVDLGQPLPEPKEAPADGVQL